MESSNRIWPGNINTVTIEGNLGAKPELREGGGQVFTTLRVIVNPDPYRDQQGNLQQQAGETTLVDVSGNQARNCVNNLVKGQTVLVEGELRHRRYVGGDSHKCEANPEGWVYVTYIRAVRVRFRQKPQSFWNERNATGASEQPAIEATPDPAVEAAITSA